MPGRSGALRLLREPWSSGPWLATIHLAVGVPIGLVSALVVGLLLLVTAPLLVTVLLAVPGLALLVAASAAFTVVQRARFAGPLGVDLARRSEGPGDLRRWRTWVALLRSGLTWRRLLYHVLAGVLGPVGFVVTLGLWTSGVLGASVLLWGWWVPSTPATLVMVFLVGVVAFHVAPWAATGSAVADLAVARLLLEPSRRGTVRELSRRVRELTDSRAEVVAAADAERRRIERDLHDGAQQRLVSLAMNLGMTRAGLSSEPEPVRRAVVSAHEEAKQALVEIRDLVRGLHPAMLDERGLDAALSGIAARSPVPVRLAVDLPHRPPPTIEAVAYFVVSEALTNVVKHAEASQVDVRVGCGDPSVGGSMLTLLVSDDGRGGARLDRSSGLRGLSQRVASVDGTFLLDSPVGGPTVLAVELPCVS
jgi:signal transduction histidine kinase